MACLHVVVTSRAGWILEWSKGLHYNASGATASVDPWLRYIAEPQWPQFDVDADGHLALPTGPGLGVDIDWNEVLRAAATGVTWRDERMVLGDGTRANW
jgi:galactonate dehydratase